jgi:hypothetical protein
VNRDIEKIMLVTVKNEVLEMNVAPNAHSEWAVTVRRGGHIQRIAGTERSSEQEVSKVLVELAADLKAGKSVLSVMGYVYSPPIKRKETFAEYCSRRSSVELEA